jgi:hypothetical protein
MWKAKFFFWNFNDMLTQNYTKKKGHAPELITLSVDHGSLVRVSVSVEVMMGGSTDPCLGCNLCSSQEFGRLLADTAAGSPGLEIDSYSTLTATPVLQATSNTDEQVNTSKHATLAETNVPLWTWIFRIEFVCLFVCYIRARGQGSGCTAAIRLIVRPVF